MTDDGDGGVDTPERADELRGLIAASPWLLQVLAAVRSSGLPDAWVVAGVLRDLVWGERFGSGFRPGDLHDIDVAFFDPHDLSHHRDHAATAALEAQLPSLPWEAHNQAAVHTWYHERFGGDPVPALDSICAAVATFPETAAAVAVRLDDAGRLVVCAPLGLADLLDGVWRRNPARASLAVCLQRLARHRPDARWPGVRVTPPH